MNFGFGGGCLGGLSCLGCGLGGGGYDAIPHGR